MTGVAESFQEKREQRPRDGEPSTTLISPHPSHLTPLGTLAQPQSPWGGCHKGLFTSVGEGWGSTRAPKLRATRAHLHPQALGAS